MKTNRNSLTEYAREMVPQLQTNGVPGTVFLQLKGGTREEMLNLAYELVQHYTKPDARMVVVGDQNTTLLPGFPIPEDAHFDYASVSDIEEEAELFEHLTDEKLGVMPNPYGYFYDLGTDEMDYEPEYPNAGYDYLLKGTRAEALILDGFAPVMSAGEGYSFHQGIDPARPKEGGFLANDHNVRIVVWVIPTDTKNSPGFSANYVTGAVTFEEDDVHYSSWRSLHAPYRYQDGARYRSDWGYFSTMQYATPAEYEKDKHRFAQNYLSSLTANKENDTIIAVISPNVDRALEFAALLFAESEAGVLVTGTNETHGSRPIAEIKGVEFQKAESLYDEDGRAERPGLGSDEDHIFDLTGPYSFFSVPVELHESLGNRRIVLVARSRKELEGSMLAPDRFNIHRKCAGLVELTGSGVQKHWA